MTPAIYQPSTHLAARVTRRLTPFFARKIIKFKLDRPVISFTFDDCPLSAITQGVSRLEEKGWRSTLYVSAGLFGTTNHHGKMAQASDIRAAHRNGHEIGGHSLNCSAQCPQVIDSLTPVAWQPNATNRVNIF